MRRLSTYADELDTEVDDYTDDYTDELDTETRDLRERLQTAWSSGNIHEACGILVEDMKLWYFRWLLKEFSSISVEDAEECFDAAVESVLNRGHLKVENIYNYLFTCVRRNALDLVEERKPLEPFDPEWIENASGGRMVLIAEAALDEELDEELTVREEQLRQLYALTFSRLSPDRRRLAKLLVEEPGLSNEDLAETLGMSKDALKSLKSRTLSDLRRLLPASADELGIDFEQVLKPTPEVLELRPLLPSEDDGEDGE